MACRALPPPALLQALSVQASAKKPLVRRSLRLLLEANHERGSLILEGVLLHRAGRYRLELFPELGGRALALWNDPSGLLALISEGLPGVSGGELRLAPEEAPSERVGAFARTLARVLAPVRADTVRAAERTDDGWRLRLESEGGLDIEVHTDRELRPLRFRFERLGASWTATASPSGWAVSGSGLALQLELGTPETLSEDSASLLARPSS